MHAAMTHVREATTCPHWQSNGDQLVSCRLLLTWLGDSPAELGQVSDDVCVACCREPQPERDRMNSVVASLWLDRRSGFPCGQTTDRDRFVQLDHMAADALPVVSPDFPPLQSLIDAKVDAETLAQHVERREAFLLLRFGDGEWCSVIGSGGHNCDGHDFLPETMGRELRSVLDDAAGQSRTGERIYVGTTRELEDSSRAVLSRIPGAEQIHWVTDAVFRRGMPNLQTLRFVRACRDFDGVKVLVGNQFLRPVARALKAHHIVIPLKNCYGCLDEVERLCRAQRADLVLCCASMASECLLWRLFQDRPEAIYADCGSIFDVMLKQPIRREYHEWSNLIAEHYWPLFHPHVGPED